MLATQESGLAEFEDRLAALPVENKRSDLNTLRRAFFALCDEEQILTSQRCLKKLADLIENGYGKHWETEKKPLPPTSMMRAVQTYCEIYLRAVELAGREAGLLDQQVNVTRQSISVTVDQAVIEERARVLAEEMVRKQLEGSK